MAYCPSCSAAAPPDAAFCPTCGSTLNAPRPHGEVDDQLNELRAARERELAASLEPRYEILRRIGRGGMGTVFLAREPALTRLVAIKMLDPLLASSPEAHARFEREGRAAAALMHPNVVPVYGIGATEPSRVPYLVMQYVAGRSLRERLSDELRIPEPEARRILADVANALDAAHRRGLVHRDVKPENILLDAETGRAVVVDFGIAKAVAGSAGVFDEITSTGVAVGTPRYMSPEQASGDAAGPASDMYSWGMVAFELLSGLLPFAAATPGEWVAAHATEAPMSLLAVRPSVAPDLAVLIERCLAKHPADRPSAGDVARAVLPAADETAWPPPLLRGLVGRARPAAAASAITAVTLCVMLGLLAFPPPALRADGTEWQRWTETGGLGISAAAGGGGGATAGSSWITAVLVTSGLGLLGVMITAWLATALLIRIVRARSAGVPGMEIWDVLTDPDGRCGLLIAGQGELTSLPAPKRQAIRWARRGLTSLPLAAGTWVIGIGGSWAALTSAGVWRLEGAAPVVGAGVVGLVVGPVVVLAIGWVVAWLAEGTLLQPLPRRRRHAPALGEPSTGAVPTEPAHGDAPSWRLARWGIPVVAAVATFALAGGFALILASSIVAARNVRRIDTGSRDLLAAVTRVTTTDPIGATRRVWGAYRPAEGAWDEASVATLLAPLPDATGPDTAVADARRRLIDLLRRNLAASAVASRRGDDASARAALAANAAIADQLTQSPDQYLAGWAVGALLREFAIEPLAALEAQLGNRALADTLRAAAEDLQREFANPAWSLPAARLVSDPARPEPYVTLVAEPRLFAAHRAGWLIDGWVAACLNARELAGGVAPARGAAVRRAAEALGRVGARLAAAAEDEWHDGVSRPPRGIWRAVPAPYRATLARLGYCADRFPEP